MVDDADVQGGGLKYDTNTIHAEVEEGWKLLLKKGSNPRQYRDTLLKRDCGYLVKDTIANFGRQNGICVPALTYYVADFLNG